MKPYYQDSSVTIYHGDCREVLPTLELVDLVLTDPPYGIGFGRYESHDDALETYPELMRAVVGMCSEKLQDGGLAFFWQGMKNADHWHEWFPPDFRIFAAIRNFTQFLPAPMQYSWDPVIWFAKGKCTRKSIAGQRDYHVGNTARYVAEPRLGHPCPRPLDTVRYLISIASDQDDTVLDPFMGSGTTLRAAKDLGLQAIGIEIEERYCEIAARRMSQEVFQFEPSYSGVSSEHF